jgi:predicted AAA+ superfamily ATPase
MSGLTAFHQQLDPSPLAGDDERYVDWQRDFDADDVKARLISSILNTPANVGSQRLLTGPRGAGKSSELLRARASPVASVAGRRS